MKFRLTEYPAVVAVLGTVLCWGSITKAEGQKLDLYGKTLLVYPVVMGKDGIPDDEGTQKLSVLIGTHTAALLEEYGVRPDISTELPDSVTHEDSLAEMTKKFQTLLAGKESAMDYSLFARFQAGPSSHGPRINRICAMLADSDGQVVWSEEQTEFPEEFTPMHGLMKLVEMVHTASDLIEPDWENRKQGPFAKRMQEKSGLPPEEEYDAMDQRLEDAKASFKNATLTIYPFRIWKQDEGSAEGAEALAGKLNEAGLFKSASVADTDTRLVAKRNPDHPGQPNIIADSARDFRAYLEAHPPETDYALLVDVTIPVHHVHFILCDKSGQWLHFNIANSHHDDFERIEPSSVEDCAELAFGRMKNWK